MKPMEAWVPLEGGFFSTNIAIRRLANGNILRNTLYLQNDKCMIKKYIFLLTLISDVKIISFESAITNT